jgi:hypothetical protein
MATENTANEAAQTHGNLTNEPNNSPSQIVVNLLPRGSCRERRPTEPSLKTYTRAHSSKPRSRVGMGGAWFPASPWQRVLGTGGNGQRKSTGFHRAVYLLE